MRLLLVARLCPPHRRCPPAKRDRRGVTLAELIVGIVLLTVGVGALASTSAYVVHATTVSRRSERAAILGRTRLDRLRVGPCAGTAGTHVEGDLTERWEVTVAGRSARASVTVAYRDRDRAVEQHYIGGFPCTP